MTDPFEEAAHPYADEFASLEELVELARRRLAERIRRAADRECSVCGRPIVIARRADAETCSGRCRKRRQRASV